MIKKITKAYFSIKGFFIRRRMKKGEYYVTKHIPNSRFMYWKKNVFYKAVAVQIGPATYTSQEKKTYSFWEIGVLDFKKG
jgi:hypothetical protein